MTDWSSLTLEFAPIDIVDGDRGKNYPSSYDFKINEGYCLFLSTKNVTHEGFKFIEQNFISEQKDKELNKGKLLKNDIVLTTRGTIGNLAIFDDKVPYEHVRINSGMVIIRPRTEHISPKWLYHFFKNSKEQFSNFTSGSAQPQLPIRDLKKIELFLPPLPEQQAIAEVLSSLDDKIDLLHKNNKTLEEMAETLFRQWFVEFKFPHEKSSSLGNKEMKSSDYGLIPKDWNYGTIGDVTGIIETGRRPKGGVGLLSNGVPSIGAENVKNIGYYNFDKTKFISEDYYEKMSSGKLQNRDILVYKDGGVPGTFIPHFSMVGEGFPYSKMAINEHVFRLVSKDKYFQNFLFFWLNTDLIVSELAERGTGAAIPGINSTQLKQTPCLVPDKETLVKFDTIVEPLVHKILKNSLSIKNLGILRDTLLPKLMSGQVRVIP
jgi:type I restriction enzyme S subunit